MKNDVKFTVITPVYNGEKFIRATIESVLFHFMSTSIEYIVIDDGSTDSTAKIINEYKDRISIITKPNAGQAEAINDGIQIAAGKYSLVVNADDPLLSNDLFGKAAEILELKPNVVVVYPDWKIIDEQGRDLKRIITQEYSSDELIGNFNCLVGPGGIFRTETAREVGGWDSSMKYVPDYKFWLEMSTRGSFQRIPETLAVWRTHESSLSVGGRSVEMAQERIKVISDFLQKYPQKLALSYKALSNAYFRAAVLTFFDPMIPGRRYLVKSLSLDKRNLLSKNRFVLLYILVAPELRRITQIPVINRVIMKIARRVKLT